MTVKRGNKHTYLGMDNNLSEKGLAKIFTSGYIDEAVEEFTEDVSTPVSGPSSKHIFKTRRGILLPEYQTLLFHQLIKKKYS